MRTRKLIATAAATLAAATGMVTVGTMGVAGAATVDCADPYQAITGEVFTFTHTDDTTDTAYWLSQTDASGDQLLRAGDRIDVVFGIAEGCTDVQVGLATYRAPSPTYDPDEVQYLFSSQGGTFSAGSGYRLSATVPLSAADGTGGDTDACPNKHQAAENTGNGANTSGAYDSNCDGSASQNGKGDGNATGKPCAGCVGNADDKNPPGQQPDGSDGNAGYECDRNHGVGKSNPAHTGCVQSPTFWQADMFLGPVMQTQGGGAEYGANLRHSANG